MALFYIKNKKNKNKMNKAEDLKPGEGVAQ